MVTREQATEQLKSLGVETPTDEQITSYLNNVNAEAIKEQNKAKAFKEKADKAEDLQKQLDELNQNGLSDLEKANKANEDLQKQIASLRDTSLKSEAKAILSKLSESGLEDADIEALIPGMVAGLEKVEDVQARANAYVGSFNKVRENAVKQKEKEDLDNTDTPGGSGGNDNNNDDDSDGAKYARQYCQQYEVNNLDGGK